MSICFIIDMEKAFDRCARAKTSTTQQASTVGYNKTDREIYVKHKIEGKVQADTTEPI